MRLIGDIWASYRALPGWVQLWLAFVLVPVNFASLFWIGVAGGAVVAILAVGGIMPNTVILVRERGLSKALAFAHLAVWPILIVVLAIWLGNGGSEVPRWYLWLLLGVNLVSLGFDLRDGWHWLRGDRAVAGR